MKGMFWFTAGAAAASYVYLRGRKIYREVLPKPLRDEIERRTDDAAVDLGRFTANFKAAMEEREAEIRDELAIEDDPPARHHRHPARTTTRTRTR